MNNYSIVEWSGGVIVCDGDQPLFFAETYDEAYSFVVGLAVMANEFLKRVIVPFQQLHENSSSRKTTSQHKIGI